MTTLYELGGTDGTRFYLEVEEPLIETAGAKERLIQSFDQLGEFVSTRCAEIIEKLKALEERARPSKTVLTFGVGIEAEGGWPFIARGSGSANIVVTCEWIAQ